MKRVRVLFLNVGFWVLYAFLLLTVFSLMLQLGANHDSNPDLNKITYVILCFGIIPAILSYLFSYLVLYKLFLNGTNWIKLISFLMLASLFIGFSSILFLEFQMDVAFSYFRFISVTAPLSIFISFISIIVGSIAFIIRAFIAWFDDQKIKEELKIQNHRMELTLVKSQLDPHFLFNTLNNIDILIENEPQKASAYLNQLSDIMRFMLFETKSDKIELKEEIRYLEKYIQLQKIRSTSSDFVTFKVEGDCSAQITPMIFIPFVENAFKHVSSTATKGAIEIGVICKKNTIVFSCSNHFQENKKNQIESHQIGHELIEKRIKLNYPTNHELNISTKNGIYAVSLILTGDEN